MSDDSLHLTIADILLRQTDKTLAEHGFGNITKDTPMADQNTDARMTFLGIPIEGERQDAPGRRVTQRPLEELAAVMQPVLDDEFITAVGWRQFTPYFNDGEPCIFGVGDPWFATVGTAQPGEPGFHPYDLFLNWAEHPTLGSRRPGAALPDPERYERAKALQHEINSGAFDDEFLKAFGDNAEVTIRRSGITIDFYEQG